MSATAVGLPTLKLREAKTQQCLNIGGNPFVPIHNFNSAIFFGYISVGTPAQNFTVVFNSVESDFWFPSKNCLSLGCLPHNKYDSSKSSSHVKDGRTYEITIDDVKETATLNNDTVTIAGLGVKNVPFGVVQTMPLKYGNEKYDGVVGLGFDFYTPYKLPTLFDQLFSQKLVPDDSFSFYVNPRRDGESALVLGGVDQKYYTGDFHYHPLVNHRYLWSVELKDIRIGETSVKPEYDTMGVATTGVGFIVGSTEIVTKITDKIGATGEIDCDKVSQLPNLEIQVEDTTYNVSPNHYILQIASFGKIVCVVGLVPIDITPLLGPTLLLGAPFMKDYYTHFDFGKSRLGFAKANKL